MFVICFIKTMTLILIYLSFGATLSVLGLYIHQIYTYLRSEKQPKQKDVNSGVRCAAKILVFTINLLVFIGSIVAAVVTYPWAMEMKDAIGSLAMAQPVFGIVFLGLSAFPFLYLRRYVMGQE